MANTLKDFFSSPDPESTSEPVANPDVTVHEDGKPGEPGHNLLTESSPTPVDEPLTPEQGEALYAPQVAEAEAAVADAEKAEQYPHEGTAGLNPYLDTNDLTPPTQDSTENLEFRDNIVNPDESVSGANVVALKAQLENYVDAVRRYSEEIAKHDEKIALIEDDLAPLVQERAKTLEAQAQIVDEINAINAKLGE